MTGASPVIRTPDQRIRVFVSSTLRELQDERGAARAAIERMQLAPVMFELGARPHPPRDLYRAYLAQSDVFVGIYWESYGWVAPDEEISGLEDEYNLTPADTPKLIYIKESDSRDERLTELIARIQADDTAAYLHFRTPEELEERVAEDLAVLLAERFDQSRPPSVGVDGDDSVASAPLAARVPVPYTETIGRDSELAELRATLRGGEHRVVSLIGPGGIGKSRLAIEAAHANTDLFPDGVYFVPLENVLEPGLLLPTIAYVLGVRDSAGGSIEERIARALGNRRVLLVLDNFEQIIEEAPVLVRLYTLAPRAVFLVTSRSVLRIRGEQVYEVGALLAPDEGAPATLERARSSSACLLFAERSRAARPDFRLTIDNAADVIDICRRLDGLPLAIELAAARSRLMSPADIAHRLERALPLLSTSARDLPERHRTMRTAIDWSVSLLSDRQRSMLEDLGVFAAQFSLDAVEAVGAGRSWGDTAIETLAALIDASLVKQAETAGRSTFSLLVIVREYALARLRERGEADAMRLAHADYYVALAERIAPRLRGAGQAAAIIELSLEATNLRAAVRHLVHTDRLDQAAEFAWSLMVYWWVESLFSGVQVWMSELLEKQRPITDRSRAIATFLSTWAEMWVQPSAQVVEIIGESARLFETSGDPDAAAMVLAARAMARLQLPDLDAETAREEFTHAAAVVHELGDTWGEALAYVGMGLLDVVQGSPRDALVHFERAAALADASEDPFARAVAGNNRGRVLFVLGDIESAEEEFRLTLDLSIRLHFVDGLAYALEGMCAISATRGEAWRAGAFSMVSRWLRRTTGMFDVEGFSVHVVPLEALRERDPDGVAAGERAGVEMSVSEAILVALPSAEAPIHDALARW